MKKSMNSKHSKQNKKQLIISQAKYILIIIALLVSVVMLLFGESKLIFNSQELVQVKFNKLYYKNVDTEEYFLTLDEAIESACSVQAIGGEDTIQVINSTTETEQIVIPAGKRINLDLNGKTITLDDGVSITNNGTLVITDTSEDGNGEIEQEDSATTAIVNNGTAIITEGIISAEYIAIENATNAELTLGSYNVQDLQNEETSITEPQIIGSVYGIVNHSQNNGNEEVSGTFNFYDGLVRGKNGATSAIDGEVTNVPQDYGVQKVTVQNQDTSDYEETAILVIANYGEYDDEDKLVSNYATLKEALQYCVSDNTIKVEKNVADASTAAPTVVAGKTVTLDLNGKTITMTGTLTNSGTLDITNGSTTEGKINSSAQYSIQNSGVLTMNGTSTSNKVTITNTGTAPTNRVLVVESNYATINTNATLTYNNTIVQPSTAAWRYVVEVKNSGEFRLAGGSIINTVTHTLYERGVRISNANSKLNVTSGTITSYGRSIYSLGTGNTEGNEAIRVSGTITETRIESMIEDGICNDASGTVKITGGTITASSSSAIANSNTGNIIISGGSLSTTTASCLSNTGTGTINISGGTISNTGNKAGIGIEKGSLTVTGGEINGGTFGIWMGGDSPTVTIGTSDGTVSTTSPIITATGASGIGVSANTGTLNFYDGVITGSTNNSITGTGTVNTPTGYTVRKSTANNVETAVLSNQYNVQYLSGNLLDGVTLSHASASGDTYSGPVDGVYTGTLKTASSGWNINSSNFTAGKTYLLKYKIQKTAGTLLNINGHSSGATQQSFTIDGVDSATTYMIPASSPASNIADDTNEHVIEFKFLYNGNVSDNNIAIQPNRGYSTSVTVNLYDVELYEVVQESSKTYGSTYGPMPTVSRTGYTLAGWHTNDNLITTDKNEWEQGEIIDDDGTISTNDSVAPRRLRLKEYQAIESNATYTLTTDSSSDIRIRYVYFYDENKTFISTNYHTPGADVLQFTTPSNCKYFKVVLQKTNSDTDTITLDELSTANLTLSGTVSSTMLVPNNDVDVYTQWMGPVLLYYEFEPYLKEGTSNKIILCIKVETDTSKYTIVKTGFVYYTGEGEPSKELTIENVDSELGIKIVGKAQERYSPTLTDSGNGAYIRAYTIIKDNVTQIEAVKYLDTRYVSAAELAKKTLTYDANGHGTAPANVTMTYADATNAAAALTATGYTFTGWNTAADGTGTAYAAGAEVKAANTVPTEMTLYAQWMLDGVNLGNGVVVNKDNVKNYLGKAVSYTDNDADTNLTYRLFYVDFDNKYGDGAGTVYLMADYDSSLKSTLSSFYSNYSSANASDSTMKIKQMNPLWAVTRGLSSVTWNNNEKSAAYLCDTNEWSDYANNDANYAIGGASTEMYIDSYKLSRIDTQTFGYAYQTSSTPGYVYTVDGVKQNSGWYTNSNTLESNKMYTNNGSGSWWLASPSASGAGYVCYVSGDNRRLGRGGYAGSFGVRPLVSLKSGVTVNFTE